MLIYAATIFLSAFLLFQVQPLIAKFILPWFGGSAAVWSAALLFFQLLLLAGYFYAHCLIRYLTSKRQLWVHAAALAASLATLPIIPSAYWKPAAGGDPTLKILLLLAATIGLPYTLLAATSPLLQAWYLRTHKGAIPYRLFALSNFGSMLALVSYPLMIEPRFALHRQAVLWSTGYAAFVLACGFTAWRSTPGTGGRKGSEVHVNPDVHADNASPLKASTMIFWVALAACASSLLLATTSHLTQNVAPIPLLWVAPLSLYLLSFILCFESGRIYQRWIFIPLLVVSLALFAKGMTQYEDNADVINILIPALCAALFVCCMVCHGELARSKPHPRYLTQFYLMVSIGGAVGGLFVALAAPHLFHNYVEMPISVGACAMLAAWALWRDTENAKWPDWTRFALPGGLVIFAAYAAYVIAPGLNREYQSWVRLVIPLAAIGFALYTWISHEYTLVARLVVLSATAAFTVYLGRQQMQLDSYYTLSVRNFYGVMRVRDDPPDDSNPIGVRVLIHGTINHGTELKTANSGRIPTSYFGQYSGISRAIRAKGDAGPIRLGVLGMGAGVTASLARAGDTLHYYEINPLVPEIANSQFNFFPSCPADKLIRMGDARLILESLPSEDLDVLAIDAFSSDAVPVHLLTREAFRIYLKHLKPDGIIIVHISSRYLNMEPIVAAASSEIGWSGVTIADDGAAEAFYVPSTWIVLSPQADFFRHPNFRDSSVAPVKLTPGFRPWTDDYSDIIRTVIGLPAWLNKFLNWSLNR